MPTGAVHDLLKFMPAPTVGKSSAQLTRMVYSYDLAAQFKDIRAMQALHDKWREQERHLKGPSRVIGTTVKLAIEYWRSRLDVGSVFSLHRDLYLQVVADVCAPPRQAEGDPAANVNTPIADFIAQLGVVAHLVTKGDLLTKSVVVFRVLNSHPERRRLVQAAYTQRSTSRVIIEELGAASEVDISGLRFCCGASGVTRANVGAQGQRRLTFGHFKKPLQIPSVGTASRFA